MRAYALRAFTNALENVTNAKSLTLTPLLLQRPLLDSLVADLSGANRPPSVVEAYSNLASVHEAAMAIKCLRLLGEASEGVQELLQQDAVLERLEVARTCGRGTHMVLQEEAEQTYSKLTEDVRSC